MFVEYPWRAHDPQQKSRLLFLPGIVTNNPLVNWMYNQSPDIQHLAGWSDRAVHTLYTYLCLIFLCLVRCLYSIIPLTSQSLSDIRTLSFPNHLFILSTQVIIFFLFTWTNVPGTSLVTKKASLTDGRIRLVRR